MLMTVRNIKKYVFDKVYSVKYIFIMTVFQKEAGKCKCAAVP